MDRLLADLRAPLFESPTGDAWRAVPDPATRCLGALLACLAAATCLAGLAGLAGLRYRARATFHAASSAFAARAAATSTSRIGARKTSRRFSAA